MTNEQVVREELKRLEAELADRQQRVARHVRHREEPLPADSEEQAQELENAETLEALDEDMTFKLTEIRKALQRLDNGSYGRCVDCGEDIPDGRLEAIPYASKCLACAS